MTEAHEDGLGAPVEPVDDDAHEDGSTARRGMSFAVVSFAVNGVVGLVGSVIVSRIYGVDIIGQYALVIAPWIMLIQLSSVAERIALVREIAGLPARSPRVTGLFVPVLVFSVLLTIVVSIPVMVITAAIYRGPADQAQLVMPALLVVIAYVLFDNTSSNLDGIFSAFRSGRDLFIGRLVQIASFPLFAIVLLPYGKNVGTLTIATVIGMVISLLVRLVLARAYLVLRATGSAIRQGVRDLPQLLKFGVKVVPGQLIGGFVDQASTWVLGAVAPISVVGSWSRAFQLAQRMNEAGYRICEILYPTLVQRFRVGDIPGFQRALARTTRFAAILVFLLAAVVGGAANGILGIFGEGFQEAAGAFAVLMFLFAGAVLCMVFSQGILASGHPHQITVTALIRSVLALGLMIPGAIYGGALGAALGLAAATTLELGIWVWLLIRVVGRDAFPSGRFIAVMAVAITSGFAVSRLVDLALPRMSGVVVSLALGTAVYGAIVMAGALEGDERATFVEQGRRLLRRPAA